MLRSEAAVGGAIRLSTATGGPGHVCPMTQMEASKPFQSRVRNLLGEMEEPILAHFPGHRVLLPSIAASRQ